MFDVASSATCQDACFLDRSISRFCGNIPIVLCGNKVDVKDRMVKREQIILHPAPTNIQYCEISARYSYNTYLPFEWLIQKLSGEHEIAVCIPRFPSLDEPFRLIQQSLVPWASCGCDGGLTPRQLLALEILCNMNHPKHDAAILVLRENRLRILPKTLDQVASLMEKLLPPFHDIKRTKAIFAENTRQH